MPTEDRRIIFNNEEIYKSIYALAAQKQDPKPPVGEIVGLKVDPDDPNRIHIKIDNVLDEKAPAKDVEYSRDFLAAALMLFCRGLGIPLPKSAKKSVLIKDDKVMLRVQI